MTVEDVCPDHLAVILGLHAVRVENRVDRIGTCGLNAAVLLVAPPDGVVRGCVQVDSNSLQPFRVQVIHVAAEYPRARDGNRRWIEGSPGFWVPWDVAPVRVALARHRSRREP